MAGGANLAFFVAAALVLIVTPGPDMLYVIGRGITQGRVAALVASCGISLGLSTHVLLAAFGLSVLLQKSATAFLLVRYAGAAYLVYLGVRVLLSNERFVAPTEGPRVRLAVAFRQGLFSNLLNPKAALFVQAFLPQFVQPVRGHAAVQVLLLGLLLVVMGLAFHIVVACGAGQIGNWLHHRPRITRWLQRLTGCVFVAIGVRLALPERR